MSKSQPQINKVVSDKSSSSASRRKKSNVISHIVVVITIFLLITAGILVFMLNLGNARDTVITLFLPVLGEEVQLSEQEELESRLRDEIVRLSSKEDELEARENQLNLRENDLNQREEELKRVMGENESLRQQLLPQVESINIISDMYKNMESEQAALILSRMENTEQVLLIIKSLDKEKSGEILGLMEPDLAAALIERMMTQQ